MYVRRLCRFGAPAVVASPCGASRANGPVSSCLDRVAVVYFLGLAHCLFMSSGPFRGLLFKSCCVWASTLRLAHLSIKTIWKKKTKNKRPISSDAHRVNFSTADSLKNKRFELFILS